MIKEAIDIEHPGIMLKEDFLDAFNVTPGKFAKTIGMDRSAVKNIIEGKRSITAEMAIRFGLFFHMSAGFWLNLQEDYDLRVAKRDRLAEFENIVQPL